MDSVLLELLLTGVLITGASAATIGTLGWLMSRWLPGAPTITTHISADNGGNNHVTGMIAPGAATVVQAPPAALTTGEVDALERLAGNLSTIDAAAEVLREIVDAARRQRFTDDQVAHVRDLVSVIRISSGNGRGIIVRERWRRKPTTRDEIVAALKAEVWREAQNLWPLNGAAPLEQPCGPGVNAGGDELKEN